MSVATSDNSSDMATTGRVARSALIVIMGIAASIAVGLWRARVVATLFGTSAENDAFTAANTIPEMLFTMLSGGALAFAFLPVYSEALARREEGSPHQLFSYVLNAIFLLTAAASIIVAILAPWLVSAPWGIAPGASASVQVQTVDLIRILLFGTIVFAVSSLVTGALHAHQHFLFPALAPSVRNVGIIIGALALAPTMGIYGLAWGAVLGSLFHLLVQVPALVHKRIQWLPVLSLTDPRLRKVAVLMAPRIVDLLLARASLEWLRNNLVSGMGEGRIAASQQSYALMDMPETLIGMAISMAVFPTMAAMAAENDIQAQRRALSGTLRAILTLAIPAAVGLIVLGRPIIQVLYEGGEFTAESTDLVYHSLQFYALALISLCMLEVVVRAFAAQKDTLTPLIVSLFTTPLNFALAYWLVSSTQIEHGGPPLATAIAVGVEATAGIVILSRRWGGVGARRILIHTGRAVIAAGAMAAVVLGLQRVADFSPLVLLAIGGGLAAVTYVAFALLLGLDEIRTIPLELLRRFIPSRQSEASV